MRLRYKNLFLVVSLFFVTSTQFSIAKPVLSEASDYRPVAIVNDVAITPIDLEKRINLLRIINNVPDSVVITAGDKKNILRSVVDEIIQAQETKRFKVEVSPERLNEYMSSIFVGMGVSRTKFEEQLKAKNIVFEDVEKIFMRKLAWEDLIGGRYGRDTTVSTYEISQIIEATSGAGNIKVKYDRITIPLENASDVATKAEEAKNILKRLQAGEDFNAISASYANQNSAGHNFVSLQEVDAHFIPFLTQASVGDISDLIQTDIGFEILRLDGREAGDNAMFQPKLSVKTGILKRNGKDNEKMNAEMQEKLAKKNLCAIYDDVLDDVSETGMVTVGELPEEMQKIAPQMTKGESRILKSDEDNITIVTVCDIATIDYYNDVPTSVRENVRNKLKAHKLQLREREYLRDLRNNAVITIFEDQI